MSQPQRDKFERFMIAEKLLANAGSAAAEEAEAARLRAAAVAEDSEIVNSPQVQAYLALLDRRQVVAPPTLQQPPVPPKQVEPLNTLPSGSGLSSAAHIASLSLRKPVLDGTLRGAVWSDF
jgi:crotonobetainyl-CoA:carnitine CoA-transferase CaiB-like acyl-CoA transferase